MVTALPEPVERVSSYLRQAGAEARIEEFEAGTPTAAEAAAAAGCTLDQIVKTLVVMCGDRPVAALVPGDRRGDLAKIARAVEAESSRVANRDEVVAATGFQAGGVAPFPLPGIEDVLIDRTLLGHPVVWAGAGSDRHMVGLAPAELVRLSRARPVDVVQAETYDSPTNP